jgi:excisionase family DNA binding protein
MDVHNATAPLTLTPRTDLLLPEMVPVPHAPGVFGISRSTLYRLAADGRIRFVKLGRSTLVDAASVRAFLASLPPAHIGSQKAAA